MNAQETRMMIVQQLSKTLNELESTYAIERSCISTEGWVVYNGGVYMEYKIDGIKVIECRAGGILKATRLSKLNAQHLAENTKNGGGCIANAVPFVRALLGEIETMKKMIEFMKSN